MSGAVSSALPSSAAPLARVGAKGVSRRVLPGFHLTLGYSLLYLSLIVLIPLSALVLKTFTLSWEQFWAAVSSPRVVASYRLTFGASFIAALVNVVFGLLVAWVLVRYRFPGRRLVDALVDLPFALPTAVAGIALTTIYAPNGWLGKPLMDLFGVKVAFTPLGVLVALTFIGLPFVVRTVQPVLEDLERELEEAVGKIDVVRGQLSELASAMEATPELEAFLSNPQLDPGAKASVLDEVTGDADPTVRNFVRVVAAKGRAGQLRQIIEEFEAIVDREQGRLTVELTTAHELDDAETAAIVRQIEQASGRTVEATRAVDPDLIGGLILQAGSLRVDASVRGRLDRLRRELVTRT